MDNIGGSIDSLQSAIKGKLAKSSGIQPLVLPQSCPFRAIPDFFTDSAVKQAVDTWVESHNPDHVIFKAEIDYSKLTIFINEIRIVSHEDIELYNLEGMIKTMTIGDSSELQIYMDRFASSFTTSATSSLTSSSSSSKPNVDSDDEDSDDGESGLSGNRNIYYHFRGLMNELFSMAYSLKVLISNISGWSFALRSRKLNSTTKDEEGYDTISLPIDSNNIKKCLGIVNSLVVYDKETEGGKKVTNKGGSSDNRSSSSGIEKGDNDYKSDESDESDNDIDSAVQSKDLNKKNNSNKKRKRKRGGGK